MTEYVIEYVSKKTNEIIRENTPHHDFSSVMERVRFLTVNDIAYLGCKVIENPTPSAR